MAKVANYIRAHASDTFQFIVISLKGSLYERGHSLVGIHRDQDLNSSRTLTLDVSAFFFHHTRRTANLTLSNSSRNMMNSITPRFFFPYLLIAEFSFFVMSFYVMLSVALLSPSKDTHPPSIMMCENNDFLYAKPGRIVGREQCNFVCCLSNHAKRDCERPERENLDCMQKRNRTTTKLARRDDETERKATRGTRV